MNDIARSAPSDHSADPSLGDLQIEIAEKAEIKVVLLTVLSVVKVLIEFNVHAISWSGM